MLRLRYLLSMLSVMVVDVVITLAYALLSGHPEVIPVAAVANVAILGGVNAIGAVVLFRRIGAYLDGKAPIASCQDDILSLPRRSTVWTLIVALLYGGLVFSLGVFAPAGIADSTSPLILGFMVVWFIFVYATYMCFVVYFAVTDLTADLRAEVFLRDGQMLKRRPGRLRTRLIIVFSVVTVLPVLLVYFDIAVFLEVRLQQGLSVEKVVMLDLFGALFAAALSLIFVTRGVARPIARLVAAVRRLQVGDLQARVPITTDDELGVLSASYNRMVVGLEERELVREAFGKYVSADVAEVILAGRRSGRLDGQVRVATVLFTDIENFSELARRMAPAAVLELMNDYLTLIAGPIQANGGVINNFIGDSVLATFNVPLDDPDHAPAALRSALAIQDLLERTTFADGLKLRTRIGINTGEIVSGSVGPPNRLAFTVIGANVNLASRIEGLNKHYGTRILVGAATREACLGSFAFRSIGRVDVKGERSAVEIYELLGEVEPPAGCA
ncbi:MAG: adenylate/guanylate cyclase domain-containing protein [Inquilinaceae bacterium]